MMEDTSVLMPLKKLCDSLCKLGYSERIRIDLGFIRDLGYYSGPIFNAYSSVTASLLGGGGRYDGLLAKVGMEGEASGFALNIKELADHCIDGSPSPKIMLWCGCSDPADGLRYADGLYKKGISFELSWTADNGNIANVSGHYQRKYDRYYEDGVRTSPGQVDRMREVYDNADSWNYEIGGDYQLGVGPGKLKLIGLRRFSNEPYLSQVITRFADNSLAVGDRFSQVGKLGETIGRAEYQWKMLGGDWQLSGEGAFNTLDNVASLGTLDASGNFVDRPFAGATGGVNEDRYEGMLSYGRKLTPKLSMQLVMGAEHSTISQTGAEGVTRSFFRPKGSFSLAWAPSSDLDIAFKARRRVMQLSFYDFLARAFLNDGNSNESNYDLRPQQDWSYDLEINKKLGAWGSTKLYFIYRDVEDRVDVIPVGDDGEAVGNIPKAKAKAIEWTSTFNLDPAGLKGVKLEAHALYQEYFLRDPFTGEKRQANGFTDTVLDANLRHDIPGTNWAWGGAIEYSHNEPVYRRSQVDRQWEGPIWLSAFVEHKDVMGLTVRAGINNIANARARRYRTVYEGLRGDSPIAFIEDRNRLIGPVFSFSVKGNI